MELWDEVLKEISTLKTSPPPDPIFPFSLLPGYNPVIIPAPAL
jgi:hypothetical protein